MNKRIRKKKHLAEFKQLGFQIAARYPLSIPDSQLDVLDAELILFLESRDLTIGGGIGREHSAFITRAWCRKVSCWMHPAGAKRNVQVMDTDRDLLVTWYVDHGAEAVAGPLVDANHSSEEEFERSTPVLLGASSS